MKKIISSLPVITILFTVFYLSSCKKECNVGYTGSDCKSEIRSQYYSSYNVVTSCSTSYVITISSSNLGIDRVEIGNIDKLGATVHAQFDESNPNTLIIPQQVSNGSTFQGSITYSAPFTSASITYNKTLSNGTILPSCTGTISR